MRYRLIVIPLFCMLFMCKNSAAQMTYQDSMQTFQKNYVDSHEVVLGIDKNYLSFYKIKPEYKVTASFKKIKDKNGFDMYTSLGKTSRYFVYGLLTFKVHDSTQQLYVYQSEVLMKNKEYFDYLFVPFGDLSSGFETYGGGRYLDFRFNDVKKNKITIDFNKAYNPYCAYTSGYNCPLPPKENVLTVKIESGEKNYGKPMH